MAYFVFFGLALLIFIMVLFFVPLGFTLRGKGLVLSASLLLSAIGLGAILLMPGWQGFATATILAGLVAYFIAKRPEEFLENIKMDSYSFSNPSVDQTFEDSYSYIAVSDNQNPAVGISRDERLDKTPEPSHQIVFSAEEWKKPAVGISEGQIDLKGQVSGWKDEPDLGEMVPEDHGVLPEIDFAEPVSAERDVEDDFWGSLLEDGSIIETEEPYRELTAGKS